MSKKELLMIHIEEERMKLNRMLDGGEKVENTYRQSLLVDRLLEQYMDLTAGQADLRHVS